MPKMCEKLENHSCKATCDAEKDNQIDLLTCMDGNVCCKPKPCKSVEGQMCKRNGCGSKSDAVSGFLCNNERVCCKQKACTSVEGQFCHTTCGSTADVIEGFGCMDNMSCCQPKECASVPGQSCHSSCLGKKTVSGFSCTGGNSCCMPLPKPDCPQIGYGCYSACANGKSPAHDYKCGPGLVCCEKPVIFAKKAVDVKPKLPICGEHFGQVCSKECATNWFSSAGYYCDNGWNCCKKKQEAPAVEKEKGSEEENYEDDSQLGTESAESETCAEYDGECKESCATGEEADATLKCADNKKKTCCLPEEKTTCDGELYKCTEKDKCSGTPVDMEGCLDGKKCCEIESCTELDGGTCKTKCDEEETSEYECNSGGRCCWPKDELEA